MGVDVYGLQSIGHTKRGTPTGVTYVTLQNGETVRAGHYRWVSRAPDYADAMGNRRSGYPEVDRSLSLLKARCTKLSNFWEYRQSGMPQYAIIQGTRDGISNGDEIIKCNGSVFIFDCDKWEHVGFIKIVGNRNRRFYAENGPNCWHCHDTGIIEGSFAVLQNVNPKRPTPEWYVAGMLCHCRGERAWEAARLYFLECEAAAARQEAAVAVQRGAQESLNSAGL